MIDDNVVRQSLLREVGPVAGQNQIRDYQVFSGLADLKIRQGVRVHEVPPFLAFETCSSVRPSTSRVGCVPQYSW